MARPTIDQISNVGDYQTLFRWNALFSSLPTFLNANFAASDINFQCYSAEIPKATVETHVVNIRGYKVKEPGLLNYKKTLVLTFAETVDAFVRAFIMDWREGIWSTNFGDSDLRKNLVGVLNLEQLDNQDNPVFMYTLFDVFLEDYDLGELSPNSTEFQKPSLTLSYAYFDDQDVTV